MPGLKEEDREKLKAKYKPVQRRLKASSRAYPLSKTLRMLSRGSRSQLDLDANRLAMAIHAINELTTDLSTPTDGHYPEMTDERLKMLNERYAEAMKACSVLINAEYLSDEEKAKPKYQTYKDMAEKMQVFLGADYKFLDTANAKMGQTLPEILSSARQIVLKASQVKFDTVGEAQASRHPVTVKLPGGKKVKGMFTEKDDFNPVKDYNELLEKLRVDPALNPVVDALKVPDTPEMAATIYERLLDVRQATEDYFTLKNYRNAADKRRAQGVPESELQPSEDVREVLARRSSGKVVPSDIFRYLARTNVAGVKSLSGSDAALSALKNPDLFEGMLRNFYNNSQKVFTRVEMNYRNIGMTGGNLDTKNAACSVFASLLGRPDLLCNSTPVKMEKADGTVVEGTLMEFAEGLSIGNVGSDMTDPDNQRFYEFSIADGIDKRPILKDIFDLEIMDYALGNVDPHGNNIVYDIQREETDYVLKGIKRIDLDNTFCINKIGDPGTYNLAHISRLHAISDSMAEKINSLTKDTLAMALRGFQQSIKNPGGLSQAAIDAAWDRIEEIKARIDDKITAPTDGKLMVLKDDDWKKYKLTDLAAKHDEAKPNGTALDIGVWLGRQSKETSLAKAKKREAAGAPKGKAKGFTFLETPATFTAKNGKEISYAKMEEAIDKVVQGLDAVADVWFGSKQYKKMRTQAKTIQSMLHEYNSADPAAPKDPDFKQNLDDELLKFMDKTEAYFVRKRGEGQKAANNENSMKRIKAATDAADFAARFVNKSEKKKDAEKQNQSGPAL